MNAETTDPKGMDTLRSALDSVDIGMFTLDTSESLKLRDAALLAATILLPLVGQGHLLPAVRVLEAGLAKGEVTTPAISYRDTSPKCAKCGCDVVIVRYIPKGETVHTPGGWRGDRPRRYVSKDRSFLYRATEEHLTNRCTRCHFDWEAGIREK